MHRQRAVGDHFFPQEHLNLSESLRIQIPSHITRGGQPDSIHASNSAELKRKDLLPTLIGRGVRPARTIRSSVRTLTPSIDAAIGFVVVRRSEHGGSGIFFRVANVIVESSP
jgi:hypothetical protein